MKTMCRFVVLYSLLILLIVSCSHAPRKGSVYINKFEVDNLKTNDPINIKLDVVQYIREALYKELQRSLIEESNMMLATSCDNAEYKLTGDFLTINTEEEGKFIGKTRRKYKVEVAGRLLRCDNNGIATDFSQEKDSDNLTEIIDDLADHIIDDVRYIDP